MRVKRAILVPAVLAVLAAPWSLAQVRHWADINNHPPIVQTEGRPPVLVNEDTVRTAREVAAHSTEPVNWTNAPGFTKDVFTFARIIYSYGKGPRISDSASPWGWITDFPDSDLNLSYRLQAVTSMKVDPDGRVLKLTDPALTDYPWIYVVEPGRMVLKDEEVPILRRYLLNGGVLMADDFWGGKQWDNFEYEIHRAMPGRSFVDLPKEHPIFHCVFDITAPLNQLQTPNLGQGMRSLIPGSADFGITWEYNHDDYTRTGARDLHVRAMLDDQGRIMVIATHNCDNGDGWEMEGENQQFFDEFSAKRAYPLGINILFYLMTH